MQLKSEIVYSRTLHPSTMTFYAKMILCCNDSH